MDLGEKKQNQELRVCRQVNDMLLGTLSWKLFFPLFL